MSEFLVFKQFNAMMSRYQFQHLPPHIVSKINRNKTFPCPGHIYDPNPRRKIVFNRRHGQTQLAYRLYWRRWGVKGV